MVSLYKILLKRTNLNYSYNYRVFYISRLQYNSRNQMKWNDSNYYLSNLPTILIETKLLIASQSIGAELLIKKFIRKIVQ